MFFFFFIENRFRPFRTCGHGYNFQIRIGVPFGIIKPESHLKCSNFSRLTGVKPEKPIKRRRGMFVRRYRDQVKGELRPRFLAAFAIRL